MSTRQWNLWVGAYNTKTKSGYLQHTQYHVFNSALCLGTLVLRDPSNAMATFALAQIDTSIDLFTSLTQSGNSTPRYYRNLQWLVKLRTQALSKLSTMSTRHNANSPQDAWRDRRENSERRDEGEEVELLGWRTRLIERAEQDGQTIRTIRLPPTLAASSVTTDLNPLPSTKFWGAYEPKNPNLSAQPGTVSSTNDLVRLAAEYLVYCH